jgi:aspartate aminotransferase
MPSVSSRADSIAPSPIRKLYAAVARQRDVRFLELNIGQPDVPTPVELTAALASYKPPVIAYGPALGTPACREAAAGYYDRWSKGVTASNVVVTTGGSEALLFAFAAVCDPGDQILVPEPFYANYLGFARMVGASIVGVRARLEDGFALPSDEALQAALTPQTRALLFSNPGNPTGAVYPASELARAAAFCRRNNLFLISDEVYRRIWFDEEPPSALSLAGCEDLVLVVDSLSKTWSACGARVGFLISRNGDVLDRVGRMAQARLCPQPMAQEMAVAAFALPDSFYEEMRLVWRGRRDAMANALMAIPGVVAPIPTGAFYAMVGLPVDDADAFALYLVERFRYRGESVLVAPGSGFYRDPVDGQREIRLAAVLDVARIERAVSLIGRALAAYPGAL